MPGEAAGALDDSFPLGTGAGDRVDEDGEIPDRQGLHDNLARRCGVVAADITPVDDGQRTADERSDPVERSTCVNNAGPL